MKKGKQLFLADNAHLSLGMLVKTMIKVPKQTVLNLWWTSEVEVLLNVTLINASVIYKASYFYI